MKTHWLNRTTLALALIVALGAALRLYALGASGYGNLYYAATVRSMLDSWHNFFFASFEPGGSVTVDKPPLGFWIQAAFAAVLGVNGLALALPQALAGILAIPLIFLAVRRTFGAAAALVAALVVAIAPVSIAADRNNTIDGLLIPLLILAAWAVLRAVETGRLRYLLLCAALTGIGFEIKMLQAFLPLPAFFGAYLLFARTTWRLRAVHLLAATALLLAVSLAWPIAVDLTPAAERPFIGSSTDNTVGELIAGHNGLRRLGSLPFLSGLFGGQSVPAPPAPAGDGGPNFVGEIGQPGVWRLMFEPLGGQIAWFLPLAWCGLLALLLTAPLRRADERQAALFLWGLWLITEVVFFSAAQLFHRYYLEMLAPPLAVLAGAGLFALWQLYTRERGVTGLLLPLALLTTAAQQAAIVINYRETAVWLLPVLLLLGAAGLGLAALWGWNGLRRQPRAAAAPLAAMLIAAAFVAPLAWSTITALNDTGRAALPSAGPLDGAGGPGGPRPAGPDGGQRRPTPAGQLPPPGAVPQAGGPGADPALIAYLETHTGDTPYLAAALNANTAAPLILATNRPVFALGGFSGGDRIFSVDDVARLVARGTLRYFVLDGAGPGGGQQNAITQWVRNRCASVPAAEWGGPARGVELYRCGR
jgi:4-amino-4-deoxy-L-arabinose transferase-like glycosyltransferase